MAYTTLMNCRTEADHVYRHLIPVKILGASLRDFDPDPTVSEFYYSVAKHTKAWNNDIRTISISVPSHLCGNNDPFKAPTLLKVLPFDASGNPIIDFSKVFSPDKIADIVVFINEIVNGNST